MILNQSPDDSAQDSGMMGASTPLRKVSVKFQAQKPATTDPMTGQQTPATGPNHGLAEISLETHPPGDAPAGGAMDREPSPQTKLDPLHEVLFKSWALAQGVQDPDAPDNHYDLRGAYKQTNGQIRPPGALTGAQGSFNRIMQAPPIQPVASHPPQLTSPGIPSLQGAIGNKVGALRGMGAPDDQDPIRQLLNMLHQGGGQ